MPSMYANRFNNPSLRRYQKSVGMSGANVRGSAGLVAPTRNVTGAASPDMVNNAARRGTLLQHQLTQGDQAHSLAMKQGEGSLYMTREDLMRKRQEREFDAQLQPGRVEAQKVGIESGKIGLEGARVGVDSAKVGLRGQTGTVEQAEWERGKIRDEYEAGTKGRGLTREIQERNLELQNTVSGAENVSTDQAGNLVVTTRDEFTGVVKTQTVPRTQAVAAGLIKDDPEKAASLRKEQAKQTKAEADMNTRALDIANRAASAIASTGGDPEEVIGALLSDADEKLLPPDAYTKIREAVEQQLQEQNQAAEKLPRNRWLLPDGAERERNTALYENTKVGLRPLRPSGSGAFGANSAKDQQAIAWAKQNPNDPRAAEIIANAQSRAGRNFY